MLLAADHIHEGNCSLLPHASCELDLLPALASLTVDFALYGTALEPALSLRAASRCKEQRGSAYVLGVTDDVRVVSPINTMNDVVSASTMATEDVLGDDLFHPHLIRFVALASPAEHASSTLSMPPTADDRDNRARRTLYADVAPPCLYEVRVHSEHW
eukprot:jgi/Tetstr1/454362/TSEL_041269.t1